MIRKNQTQLNFLYGEEAVNVLKKTMKDAIKNGDYVTINIDSLDELDDKCIKTAKIKLFIKRLFHIM